MHSIISHIFMISSAFIYFYWYENKNLVNIYMGNIKQINIKKRTYYLFNDIINIKSDSHFPKKIVLFASLIAL